MGEDTPNNIFQFPGRKAGGDDGDGGDVSSVKPGAFIDQYGPSLFRPIADIDDASLSTMLYEFKQHRALADCLVDLMQNELDHRARTR
ncbi:hypothetical protein [Mesorhizobium sp.]|uniref:hypothetical protein n=1 Tax=Mesorhizobium sp. TaxID=1871066 RepID=UPI000FE9DE70|nr:hypothetical protein [Mesorhizobium sp.]RWQ64137.1 MAG: hypothetical protein EOS86_21265 [Mesorhizobium sp.]